MDGEEKENANGQKKESDGEDDIPLDLILKEEPFEVINGQIEPETNNQAIINQESTKNESELCAFENCGICKQNVVLGQGKWAKLLGCLHTFCTECIEKSERDRHQADNISSKVLCPVCRCLTPRSLLADNHFVKPSQDEKALAKPVEVKKICGSCEDEEEEGEQYCIDCVEWLCRECVLAHKRVKLTKTHQLTDSPPETIANGNEDTMMCPLHPTEPLQLFCDSCDTLTCRDCQLQTHRDHRYDYVRDASQREKNMLISAQPSLDQKQKALGEFQTMAEARMKDLTQRENVLIAEIDTYCEGVIKAIQAKQLDYKATVKSVLGERRKDVQAHLNTSNKLMKAITHSQNFVNYIEDPSKVRGLLCARKLVKDYFNLIIREPCPSMRSLIHCNTAITFNNNSTLIDNIITNQLAQLVYEPHPRTKQQNLPPLQTNAQQQQRHHQLTRHPRPSSTAHQLAQARMQNIRSTQQHAPYQTQQSRVKAAYQQLHLPRPPQQHNTTAQHQQRMPHHRMPVSPQLAAQQQQQQQQQQLQSQMFPQVPSPQLVRSSPVLSPNLMPNRPHSTDSGHSSDIVRHPAATPPVVAPAAATAVANQQQQPNPCHNDSSEEWCAICWNGGQLFCCDTCPKVYHRECHQPFMTEAELAPDADFVCSLCRWNDQKDKANVQLQADFILLTLLADRELDPIQRFCSEVIKTLDYKNSVRNPLTYQMIRLKTYTHLEQFLSDILVLSNNITVYSADSRVLDCNEMLKIKISTLIRQVKPTTLHYWMSISMKPPSPLRKTVKRIVKPKQAEPESDEDDDDDDKDHERKKIKLEKY